jgi:hypothetical protein
MSNNATNFECKQLSKGFFNGRRVVGRRLDHKIIHTLLTPSKSKHYSYYVITTFE